MMNNDLAVQLMGHTFTSKLKSENKKLWLKALRGDKYNQGRRCLCDADGKMCCLGVLRNEVVHGYWYEHNGFGWRSTRVVEDPENTFNGVGFPTKSDLKKMGLSESDALFFGRLNDSGATFWEIADIIEKHL